MRLKSKRFKLNAQNGDAIRFHIHRPRPAYRQAEIWIKAQSHVVRCALLLGQKQKRRLNTIRPRRRVSHNAVVDGRWWPTRLHHNNLQWGAHPNHKNRLTRTVALRWFQTTLPPPLQWLHTPLPHLSFRLVTWCSQACSPLRSVRSSPVSLSFCAVRERRQHHQSPYSHSAQKLARIVHTNAMSEYTDMSNRALSLSICLPFP